MSYQLGKKIQNHIAISRYIHSYMALYCLVYDTSKAAILQSLIKKWMQKETKTELTQKLITKYKIEWREIKASDAHLTIQSYKEQLEYLLRKKKVSENHITAILKEIKD